MPYFRYSATDATGKSLDGVLQANDWSAAQARLKSQGMTIHRLMDASGGPRSGGVATQAAPVVAAAVVAGPAVATAPPTVYHATRRSNEKERFFLFSQFAQMMSAGLTPQVAADHLMTRASPKFRPALEELARETAVGVDIATTFSHYPDLFPPGTIGMIRAGQEGGFLPESLRQIGEQQLRSHKFRRWFWWAWAVLINALVVLPGMWFAGQGLLKTWDLVESTGAATMQDGLRAMRDAFLDQLRWPFGPIFLLILALGLGLRWLLAQRRYDEFRHGFALMLPEQMYMDYGLGKRTRHENIAIFSWTLGKLSAAGIHPARAYALAADSVPNMVMSERLRRMGTQIHEATPLSQIVGTNEVFPHEYRSMVATAEMTGGMPAAMQQLTDMSEAEYNAGSTHARVRMTIAGMMWLAITALAGMAIFYHAWYVALPGKVLQGMDP